MKHHATRALHFASYAFLLSLVILCTDAVSQNVVIGTQTWTKTNLDVAVFRNGDSIQHAQTDDAWDLANMFHEPAWCYYKSATGEVTNYGKLYNWYAVADPRGLAPAGWHVPTVAEWEILDKFLGKKKAGMKMKSTADWTKNTGTNASGFNALPGGERGSIGFFGLASFGHWWCSSGSTSGQGVDFWVSGGLDIMVSDHHNKNYGFSVRCVEGEATIPTEKTIPNQVRDSIIGKTTKIGNMEVARFDIPGPITTAVAKAALAKLGPGWRIPTIEELDILYARKTELGSFANGYYWRAAPEYPGGFTMLNFKDNTWGKPTSNFSTARVRPVRTIQ